MRSLGFFAKHPVFTHVVVVRRTIIAVTVAGLVCSCGGKTTRDSTPTGIGDASGGSGGAERDASVGGSGGGGTGGIPDQPEGGVAGTAGEGGSAGDGGIGGAGAVAGAGAGGEGGIDCPTGPISTSPRDGEVGVAADSNVVATIPCLLPETMTLQTFRLYSEQSGFFSGSLFPLQPAGVWAFVPAVDFRPGERVTAVLTSAVTDLRGTPIGPYVWQFDVATAPSSGQLSPDQDASIDPDHLALGDLDSDGDLDAFLADEFSADGVWLNDGSGQFSDSGQQLGDLGQSVDVALGDLDSDGDLDALVLGGFGPDRTWLNDATGQFNEGQDLGSSASGSVALGDVDGDGDLDAFVAHYGEPSQLWLNDGTGLLTQSEQLLAAHESTGVALGDLDGDGDLDVFLLNSPEPHQVLLNDGTGLFAESRELPTGVRSVDVALGDLDEDGDLDAFVAGLDQGNRVLLNDGTGQFSVADQTLSGSGLDVAIGDVDGDGDLDALVVPPHDGHPTVWLNDGAARFQDGGQGLEPGYPGAVELGDVDGDGDLDALTDSGLWINGP